MCDGATRLSGIRCVNKLMEILAAALQLLAKRTGPSCVHALPDLYDANETVSGFIGRTKAS